VGVVARMSVSEDERRRGRGRVEGVEGRSGGRVGGEREKLVVCLYTTQVVYGGGEKGKKKPDKVETIKYRVWICSIQAIR